jgi:threonine aldolase
MLGGGMRQVGVLAAAGLYALDHHVARLADDHAHTRLLFDVLSPAVHGALQAPETNILMLDLPGGASAEAFANRAREAGVLVSVFGPSRVRLVTHLDVDRSAVTRAAETLGRLVAA